MKVGETYTGEEIKAEFEGDINDLIEWGEWEDKTFATMEFVAVKTAGVTEFVSACGCWVLSVDRDVEPQMEEMDARQYLVDDGYDSDFIKKIFGE